jgi:hypothetical protein
MTYDRSLQTFNSVFFPSYDSKKPFKRLTKQRQLLLLLNQGWQRWIADSVARLAHAAYKKIR